jgi:hypothetical protein
LCDLTFLSEPRITPERFAQVLRRAHSPAAPASSRLYLICRSYGIDPAVALAFFQPESSFGTAGKALVTLNWGNIRKGQGHQRETRAGWAWYDTWEDSLRDWCMLITRKYIGAWGHQTVGEALPIYAPSSDNNRPAAYAAAVCRAVAGWQG